MIALGRRKLLEMIDRFMAYIVVMVLCVYTYLQLIKYV
jgi:hypothetical protein